MRYLVMDVYPRPGSDAFRTYCGAAAGCWIRADLAADEAQARVVAAERIADIGWSIARFVSSEEVSANSYAHKPDVLELFGHAQVNGFYANFHTTKRVTIGDSDMSDEDVIDALIRLSEDFCLQNAVSLYSESGHQWANGTFGELENGDGFLPLWLIRDVAPVWRHGWPGYEPRNVSEEGGDFLERVNQQNMWIGMGIGDSLLTMCHPLWVRDIDRPQ